MSVLYVLQPDAILNKQYEAFTVALQQEDGTWNKRSVPVQTMEQIVLMGNPQITGDALTYALELGVPIHYLSGFGKYLGSALPGYSRNGQLRLAQYEAYFNTTRRLEIAKTIVAGKLRNQQEVLSRSGCTDNSLKALRKKVWLQSTLDEVRGIEGIAAKEYFGFLSQIIKSPWTFSGRHRRPPTDPVNALLSFAYGLLRVQVTSVAHMAGLDPYIGYLHEANRGQPAMVLDLMEEFRPLVADKLVLAILNNKEIQPQDFEESLGAYRLSDSARKTFLQAFERKMKDDFKHPTFEYRCTYRRGIELQARLFARHLQEYLPYKALVLR
jgi:CRISPR-associated protein Cas1